MKQRIEKQQRKSIKSQIVSWKKINKIDKTLARLTNKIRILKLLKLRIKGDITSESTELENIIREFYEQLFSNILDNRDKMNKFVKKKEEFEL